MFFFFILLLKHGKNEYIDERKKERKGRKERISGKREITLNI